MNLRYLRVIIALIIISAAFIFSFNSVMNALSHSSSNEEIEVPDITGKTVAQALDILEPTGFGFIIEYEEGAGSSAVIKSQSPSAGSNQREGSIVKVVIG
ncbi:MAG: PASTA domain-containing protein [Elusimicrobiota bacterium]|jgi:beta-lactam-binding protein with PASTA domain|nr:PASTA domain-containing protein [Elusimicrobiota bacterium]